MWFTLGVREPYVHVSFDSLELTLNFLVVAGSNSCGQLGSDITSNTSVKDNCLFVPARIDYLPGSVSAISAGASHSVFVCDGDLFGCGSNAHGQLGQYELAEVRMYCIYSVLLLCTCFLI